MKEFRDSIVNQNEKFLVLLENGVIRRGHMENNLNNFYNK